MDPVLDLQRRRLLISALLTAQARRRLGDSLAADSSPGDLLDLADRLREGTEPIERGYGLGFDPAYPGVTAGPQIVGDTCRLVLACNISDRDGAPVGVVFSVLIAGRHPQVSVAPAGAEIPGDWRPPHDFR